VNSPTLVQGVRQRLHPVWQGSLNLLAKAAEPEQVPYSSVVIEYTVPQEKSWAFRKWHQGLVHAAHEFPGFIRADRHRPLPCQGGVLKWYSVVHFEQPEDLNRWLLSPKREALLKLGRDLFRSYKFKSFETGLEGWFSHHSGNELTGLGPPAWKQIISVVLGLYPVIMIQDWVIDALDLMKNWDPASAMLVKNLVTTCILTLVVMPLILRTLDFWLQPAHRRASMRIEIAGATFTIAAMVAMVFVFSEMH
jgi:antibiotic biosynthesis monooxygenase (ABM) superfamily enzyme